MWFCKVKNIKIKATIVLFIVAKFSKINCTQNTTNSTEITENLLNSVPHTIEIKFQIGEKFSLIVAVKSGISHILPLLF